MSRKPIKKDACIRFRHTFRNGDTVWVFDEIGRGRYSAERSTVFQRLHRGPDEFYLVRFHHFAGKPMPRREYERVVDPAAQMDPNGHLQSLNAKVPA